MPAGPDPDRVQVAECLRAFRRIATPERRQALWRCAYARWQAWRFDNTALGGHLLAVNWSKLDYAVVGFVVECMDEATRAAQMNTICREMQFLDDQWHASVTDIKTKWNRLLSRFQPYARAIEVAKSDEEWLTETKTYSPIDTSKISYLGMKYG